MFSIPVANSTVRDLGRARKFDAGYLGYFSDADGHLWKVAASAWDRPMGSGYRRVAGSSRDNVRAWSAWRTG